MIESQMEDVDAAWAQILRVEARVLELKEELKKRRVIRLSMTRSPIFALPVEILQEVFFYLGVHDIEMEPSPTPVNLVCRHWRAITSPMRTLSLRAIPLSAESLDPILPALHASFPHPVHLTVEAPRWTSFPLRATASLSCRLKSLAWNVPKDLNEFLGRLAYREDIAWLSRLETLTVKGLDDCSYDHETTEYTWPVVHLEELENLPSLADLRLEKAVVDESLTSKTLTSLTISSCTLESHGLVTTIECSPNLKMLSISQVDFTTDFDLWPDLWVFTQSSLERIVILHVGGTTSWAPLFYGRYPNLQFLSICGLSSADPDLFVWWPRLEKALEKSFYYTVSKNHLFSVLFGVAN